MKKVLLSIGVAALALAATAQPLITLTFDKKGFAGAATTGVSTTAPVAAPSTGTAADFANPGGAWVIDVTASAANYATATYTLNTVDGSNLGNAATTINATGGVYIYLYAKASTTEITNFRVDLEDENALAANTSAPSATVGTTAAWVELHITNFTNTDYGQTPPATSSIDATAIRTLVVYPGTNTGGTPPIPVNTVTIYEIQIRSAQVTDLTTSGPLGNPEPASAVNNTSLVSSDLVLFPNPADAQTTLSYNLVQSGNVKVVVTDVTGKVAKVAYEGGQSAGQNSVTFDVADLNKGTYIVSVYVNGAVAQTRRLSVQ